jgi:hypothetical protein
MAIARRSQRDLFQFRSEHERWPRTDELEGWNQEMHGRRAKASRVAAAEKNLKAAQRERADAQAQARNALSAAEKGHANAVAQASASLEAWKSPGRGSRIATFKGVELYQHAIVTKRGPAAVLYAHAAVAGNFLTIQSGGAQEVLKLDNNEVPGAHQFASQVGAAAGAEVSFEQQRPAAILAAEQYLTRVAADTAAIELAREVAASTESDPNLLGAIQAAEQSVNGAQAETIADAAQAELDAHKENASESAAARRPTWQPRVSNAAIALVGIVLIAVIVGGTGAVATAPASHPTESLANLPSTETPTATDTSAPVASATPVPTVLPPTVAPTLVPTPVPTPPPPDPHQLTVANVTMSIHNNEHDIDPFSKFDRLTVRFNGGEVDISAKPALVANESDLFKTHAWNTYVASKAILGWYPAAEKIRVSSLTGVTDRYGRSSTDEAIWTEISSGTAARFDYGGLQGRLASSEANMYCVADGYSVAPYIWSKLSSSDRGCMVSPTLVS